MDMMEMTDMSYMINRMERTNETKRKKSDQLKILESLNSRTHLAHAQQQYMINLQKGFEGEALFDKLIQNYLGTDRECLQDRLITYNGSTAQIDALILIGNTLNLYEVKNYEGEHQQLSGHFRRLKGQEFICPSIQLNRTEKVLRQILSQWTETFEVHSYVIFVNPAFTLYDAKISDPFILPTQIRKHFEKLKKNQTQSSKECIRLINKLQSESRSGEKYRGTPQNYAYEDLRKGLICSNCHSFNLKLTQRQAICRDCGEQRKNDRLLLSHIDELTLLFPETKLTTALVYDWIDGKLIKRRIGRLLHSLS
ncbi:Nuclease-related domain-containing protein [Alkalibacterium putridalgicola]|uniref:Nuclease-related domain-containing protein n=1 Tax=Alkalibacterium putridalgicola TaxID=426703 RepID=A0A1H7SFF9_9LACT|nr:nuclease-related domain-containing protein [Alkalibacterium putridalgicola]GEK88770.1 hypothetical protein APU01nite_08090 [Alkalibacterium putridalgicola]SEL71213.1 Nuclease-related domain-containing protein [Alkalibacterium putridalgicola]